MSIRKSDRIISVEHVSKYFGEKAVLNDVNLQVRKGEFVTILGPSGCGKTTLLRLIAGFQTASEGVITMSGKEITQTPPHKRPVNTVFQKYALFPHLNVYNNIAFGLKLKKLPKAEIEKKVKELKDSDPKLKRVFPIFVEGDEDEGEKPYYIGYFKQPPFPTFSKYLSLSQKDQAGAMRELAKDCFVDGDKELIKDDSLFIYGLMPHLAQIIELRKGKLVNLSKAGK